MLMQVLCSLTTRALGVIICPPPRREDAMRAEGSGNRRKRFPAPDIKKQFSRPALRALAALACAASILLLAATPAAAQSKLDRIEWFAEGGGSLFRLGQQPGVIQVPETSSFGMEVPPYQGTVIDPGSFSSAGVDFTGLGYRLTPRDLVEVSWSSSVNWFGLNLVPEGGIQSSHFERSPNVSLGYARYLGRVWGWRPFVVGGFGEVWTNALPSGVGRAGASFDFGFGADHRITERLAFRVESRDFVERLPSPLHGYSHDIEPMAGLVISSRPAGSGTGGLSRIEFFLEGGGSFFTGATLHTRIPVLGTRSEEVNAVVRNSYSETGRYAGGFRVYLSPKGALQAEFSVAPNHFQRQLSTTGPPAVAIEGGQYTQSVESLTGDYVRYLTARRALEPFVAGGAGLAHFPGFYSQDVDKFCLNLSAGVDIPLARQLALRFEMDDFLMPQLSPPGLPPMHSWTNNLAPMAGLALRFR
jgi:hypothetical protein